MTGMSTTFTQLSVPATEIRPADRLLGDYGWAGPPISSITVDPRFGGRVEIQTVNGGRRHFLIRDEVRVYRPSDPTSAEAWATSVEVS